MQEENVEWGPLDDVVMGGVSESSFARMQSGSEAVFSGRVSAANNGGFASVSCKRIQDTWKKNNQTSEYHTRRTHAREAKKGMEGCISASTSRGPVSM